MWTATLIDFELLSLFVSIVGMRMFPSLMSVLLVTALTRVWAQDFYEERKSSKKSKVKPLRANTDDGQGKKTHDRHSEWFVFLC